MKYTTLILAGFILCILSQPAWTHHCAEELGHHWESHAYIHEIHFQMILMAAMAFTVTAILTFARMRKKRTAGK